MDSRSLVPSRWAGWIWASVERYCGIWWKPIPHGANRVKSCSRKRPLASELSLIRADRPHFEPAV